MPDSSGAVSFPSPTPGKLLDQALSAFREGDLDTAECFCRQVLDESPFTARAYSVRGKILESRGQPAEALAAFQSALACDPDYLPARWRIAILHVQQGRSDEALAALDELVRQKPDMHPAHQLRVRMLAIAKKAVRSSAGG